MIDNLLEFDNDIKKYKSNDIVKDISNIIDNAQDIAYKSINIALLKRNWLIGNRISVEVLNGENRAKYGATVINNLSLKLTKVYGRGFNKTNLYNFYMFYRMFPRIFHSSSGKLVKYLSWTHYRILLQVKDNKARDWYLNEAINQTWSVRTLQRNISSQYYYRILKVGDIDKTNYNKDYINDKLEFIKNPVITEFLGISNDDYFTENTLESAIINNLQKFIMELGKGYAFIARQQHIHTEKEDYYIDLVFYNYILKCFILIDLKTTKITHQDVGQMDMYIRMYDELKKCDDDNPTLGIILCSDTDEDIARYSILKENEQLFASKYKLYLPTEEELRKEIESQKTLFYLQNNNK